jgi:hypothetical protein
MENAAATRPQLRSNQAESFNNNPERKISRQCPASGYAHSDCIFLPAIPAGPLWSFVNPAGVQIDT